MDHLTPKQKSIVLIASHTIRGDMDPLNRDFVSGLESGLSVNEIKEILLQMASYAGFPRSLNGIVAFQKLMEKRKEEGISDTIGPEPKALPAGTNKNEYGEKVRTKLVGNASKGAYATFLPAVDDFLKEHLFADTFGRGVLSDEERELATIAALSSVDGLGAQLGAHLNIGLHVGLKPEQLQDVISTVGVRSSYSVLQDVLEKKGVQNSKKMDDTPIQVLRKADFVKSEGDPDKFSGKVEVEYILGMLPDSSILPENSMGLVSFAKGARTAWHTHPKGQLLIIVSGVGRVRQEGGDIMTVQSGDVVWFPPGVKHWHGAAENSEMSHYAITPMRDGSAVTWMDLVK